MSPSVTSETTSGSSDQKNIVFFHPDLGIGGAERLIVDAAVGLQELGHKVTIFTSHCDPKHCFDEARDGTLDVRIRGNTLPVAFLSRFHILLAILRQIHLVLAISYFTNELSLLKPDAFIVDQLSACVPLLRWMYPKKQRTLFYCHFPDQMLVQHNEAGLLGLLKKIYRFPFNWFEEWSTGASDKIVVNSNFTKSVTDRIFPTLDRDFDVIYPCVNTQEQQQKSDEQPLWNGQYKILLSINRFERKKEIGLAIRAYAALSKTERKSTRLVIAGGYDPRVTENVQYHDELSNLAGNAGLKAATAKTVPTALAVPADVEVLFLLSVPGSFKETLLKNATLLLYTPTNEHFGIVPVEAMQYGVPVLADTTGGPTETIIDNETGWLRDAKKPEEWTVIIRKVLSELTPSQFQAMGIKGRERVKTHFTRQKMAVNFHDTILQMGRNERSVFVEKQDVIIAIGMIGVFAAAIIAAVLQHVLSTIADERSSEFARVRRARRQQSQGDDQMVSALFGQP